RPRRGARARPARARRRLRASDRRDRASRGPPQGGGVPPHAALDDPRRELLVASWTGGAGGGRGAGTMTLVDHAEVFVEHRPTMLAAAYRVTGSRHDAEDVVQEAWLSWSRVELAEVREPRTFLAVMVSRLALNAVRARSRRREEYVGPWLPEPVLDDGDPAWAVLHEEGFGLALDVALSGLTP